MQYRQQAIAARIGVQPAWYCWLALLFLAVVFANSARADQLSFIINGKAVHLGAQANQHYNEKNWGGGFQYDFDKSENDWVPFVTASGFNDSNRNPSYYAGGGAAKRYMLGESDFHIDFGGVGFVMTRHGYRDDKPFLGALPFVSVGTENVAVNMTYIPKMDPKWVPLWFFQLKVSVDTFR